MADETLSGSFDSLSQVLELAQDDRTFKVHHSGEADEACRAAL